MGLSPQSLSGCRRGRLGQLRRICLKEKLLASATVTTNGLVDPRGQRPSPRELDRPRLTNCVARLGIGRRTEGLTR
jgi:hypothetical protein